MKRCDNHPPYDTEIVQKIFWDNNSRTCLDVRYCYLCDTIFKYRQQFGFGTGYDNVIIYPGQDVRGYQLTWEDEAEYRKKIKNPTHTEILFCQCCKNEYLVPHPKNNPIHSYRCEQCEPELHGHIVGTDTRFLRMSK